jgi:hypothetical protein
MGKLHGFLAAFVAFGVLVGCAAAPAEKKDYTKFRSENPRSILVVPVVNNTVNVDAPDYFLSTVSFPIAERGYYIFPINLVKNVMEEEGLSDANLVHSADPARLGELYGADSILYISIENWETTYAVLVATTTVSFEYILKSGKTGEEFWRETSTINYTPQSQSSGGGLVGLLVVMAINAAVQKAAPNYMPLARQANGTAVNTVGQGLPAGPYHQSYEKDTDQF